MSNPLPTSHRQSSSCVTVRDGEPGSAGELASLPSANPELLRLPNRFDAAHVERHGPHWSALASSGRNVIAEASHVTFIDSTGIGAMIRLARLTRDQGAQFLVAAPSGVVQRALEMMKLTALFTIVSEVLFLEAA